MRVPLLRATSPFCSERRVAKTKQGNWDSEAAFMMLLPWQLNSSMNSHWYHHPWAVTALGLLENVVKPKDAAYNFYLNFSGLKGRAHPCNEFSIQLLCGRPEGRMIRDLVAGLGSEAEIKTAVLAIIPVHLAR